MLNWYAENGRDLPWRKTSDAYRVWVSEIMCQQTRVATAIPFFERWLDRFPNVQDLAEADEQEVLSRWQGLGYYRRARLLQAGARHVAERGWPTRESEWRQVPGVGAYTAAAIASIALGEPAAVVDGNVERVYARFLADHRVGSELHRAAKLWAGSIIDPEQPGDWNQALMELGALVCVPRSQKCGLCPLAEECQARQQGTQALLPRSKPKPENLSMTFDTFVPYHAGLFGIRMVPTGDWWQGLWEFDRQPSPTERERTRRIGTIRHVVTRHHITQHAYLWEPNHHIAEFDWCTPEEITRRPMPAPQRKILKMAEEFLSALPID